MILSDIEGQIIENQQKFECFSKFKTIDTDFYQFFSEEAKILLKP